MIYRARVHRGNRKRPVTKGQTYGKPKTHGVNELKNARSKQAVAEVNFPSKNLFAFYDIALLFLPCFLLTAGIFNFSCIIVMFPV